MYGVVGEDMVIFSVSYRPCTCILDTVEHTCHNPVPAQHSTAQHSTGQHSTAQGTTAQHLPHLHRRVCLSPEPVVYAPTHCPWLWHFAWEPLWPATLPRTHGCVCSGTRIFLYFTYLDLRVDILGNHPLCRKIESF